MTDGGLKHLLDEQVDAREERASTSESLASSSIRVERDSATAPCPPRLLDAAEIAAALSVSKWTIFRWGKEGRIPTVRLGRKTRFELDRVMAALRCEATVQRVGRESVQRARSTPQRALVPKPATGPRPKSAPRSHDERLRDAIEATQVLGGRRAVEPTAATPSINRAPGPGRVA